MKNKKKIKKKRQGKEKRKEKKKKKNQLPCISIVTELHFKRDKTKRN